MTGFAELDSSVRSVQSQQPSSDNHLANARKYLNELVFKGWVELDDKLIEYKEYEDRRLQTWEQDDRRPAALQDGGDGDDQR